jgi:hypothetical membrane protein
MTLGLFGNRLAIASAPIACALFLLLYVIAASQDPEYIFLESYLSDLGVGPGAWAFNAGVMIAGAMLLVFAVLGLSAKLPADAISRAGTALLALAGIFLVNVGIFTEDAGDTHLVMSYAFFITLLVSLGVLAVAMYRDRRLGNVPLFATVGSFIAGLALALVFGATPFTETLAVLLIIAWGFVVPGTMLTKAGG